VRRHSTRSTARPMASPSTRTRGGGVSRVSVRSLRRSPLAARRPPCAPSRLLA
jgi:hypothetical protein